MNKPSILSLVLFGLLGFAVLNAANPQLWTCGMHPQIIKTEPGNCPICGMKLTPVRANSAANSPGAANNGIQIDAVTVQRMNLKTGLVTRGPVRREIRSVGSVAYNEEGLRDITTKYEGWIEKLFVNSTYTKIKAGDPLFEIYSPDLYNAELNYLVARRGEADDEGPLTRAALGRLQLFDIPTDFVRELARTGQAQRTFVYRAPVDGVVIEKSGVVGQMVKPGERIYRIADLTSVWVLAQIYEQDLPFVRSGQSATVRLGYGNDRIFGGTVALVLPEVEEQTRAATARIALSNSDGALRPGMYVDVRFETQIADSAVLVPETAILRSGDRNTVFIARDAGTFEPREVKLGARSAGGEYEVLSGLSEGDRVVVSGQFMLDSESQLREAIEKMSKDEGSGAPRPSGSGFSRPPENAAEGRLKTGPTPKQQDALRTLAFATADAAVALAADDLAGYNTQRDVVNKALDAWLAGSAGIPLAAEARNGVRTLSPASDLKSAREAFEPFSTVVTDLARASHVEQAAGLHAFECPMSPATGKARWLQREPGTKNPFYGSAMPNCGEELK